MPFPFLPFAVALGAGAFGIKKGIDAKNDMDLANWVNEEARKIAKSAEQKIEAARSDTASAIENLGKQKIRTLSGSINDFVHSFEKIKNIDFRESQGLDELKKFDPQGSDFIQLKQVSMEATEIAVNGIGAISSGALLAFGTYNVVMGGMGGLLVTATTGTPLATLSGAAATKATLAWLGGGAIKAGGLGIFGGQLVLGGLVAGPALAVGGALFAKQAEKAYWDANSNREKAKAFDEQATSICSVLKSIQDRAEQLQELLQNLDRPFTNMVRYMEFIIQRNGTDWKDYAEHDRHQIYKCVQFAQVIKMVLDTSLLNDSGELTSESKESIQTGNSFLQKISG